MMTKSNLLFRNHLKFILVVLFITGCRDETKIYELQTYTGISSIEVESTKIQSQEELAKIISKNPQFINFMQLIRGKNEKYKDKMNEKFLFSEKLIRVEEVDWDLKNGKSIEEIYSSIYKNPSDEIHFINNSRASILTLQKTFPLLNRISENDRLKVFKLAMNEYFSSLKKENKKLKIADCPWNCNVDFNNTLQEIDIVLGIGMLGCVWGTEGLAYSVCLAAAAYAYDFAWNQALNSLGNCFLRCAEP